MQECVCYRKCVWADVSRHHHVNGIHLLIIDVFSLMEINEEPVWAWFLANAEYCECCL